MKFIIPLMPAVVEIRRRRLTPVRVSLRSLMVAVIFAGVFFAISAQLMRLNRRVATHQGLIVEGRLKLAQAGSSDVEPTMMAERWHEAKMREAFEDARRYDVLFFALVVSTFSVTTWFVLGQLLNTFIPRPSPEATPDPPQFPMQPEDGSELR